MVCGYPREYYAGRKVPKKEWRDGLLIRRIGYIQSKRSGKLGRLINYLSFTASVFLRMDLLGGCKVILCYTNPPILPAAALLASRLHREKLALVIYDVYPEVAYASGHIRRGNMIDRLMRQINHKAYKRAERVIALSDEMRDFLLSHRPETDGRRVRVIPNWAHEENVPAEADTSPVSAKIHVSYFGNMGICQDVETMLAAAKAMASDENICFDFVGHGNKKESVEQYVAEHHLSQVSVRGYLTGKKLRLKLQESSCCVVSLTEGLKGLCAPSKYYTYLYMGKPIISVGEKDSFFSREVEAEGIGFAVAVGDVSAFQAAVRFFQTHPDRTAAMGKRARALYERKYRYELAMARYQEAVDGLLSKGAQGRNEGKIDHGDHSDKE